MPTSSAYAVPGLTSEIAPRGDVPDICRALDEPDEKRRVSLLQDVAEDWFRTHAWYYAEAAECQAFDAGAHWGCWSPQRNLWLTLPQPKGYFEPRAVVNVYKAILDQATAMLCTDDPTFDTTAVKDDVRDVLASQATSEITGYWWRHADLSVKYKTSARNIFNTGTTLIYVRWDPMAGPLLPQEPKMVRPPAVDPMTGELLLDPETGEVVDPGEFEEQPPKHTGEVKFDVLPVDAYAPDPAASSPDDMAGSFIRVQKPMSWLRTHYPEQAAEIRDTSDVRGQSTGTINQESAVVGAFSPVSGDSGGTMSSTSGSNPMVWIYTWYGRQTPQHPRGTMMMFASRILLSASENPVYPVDGESALLSVKSHVPVISPTCEPRQGQIWGMGRGVAMIGPQRQLNGVLSKWLLHLAKVANAKLTMPASISDAMNDIPGQVLRIPRTASARDIGFISPPQVPEYQQAIAFAQAQMEFLAGIGAASNGQLPAADTSGIALSRLQQRDKTRIDPVKRVLDGAWAEAIRLGIRFSRRWMHGSVKALVVGPNKRAALKEFDANTFADEVDVTPFNNTALPGDPAQRMTYLMQLGQVISAVQDPDLRRAMLRMVNLRDIEGFLDTMNPSEEKMLRVTVGLLRGDEAFVTPADNPLACKAVLHDFMQSEQYEDQVRAEKAKGGASPLETRTNNLFKYYTMAAMPGMPAAPGQPPGPGAPMQPPEMAPPAAAPAAPMEPVAAAGGM